MRVNAFTRRAVSTPLFVSLVSLLNLALFHQPLLTYIAAQDSSPEVASWLTLFSLLFMLSQLLLLGLALVSQRLCRWFSYLILLGNALALYFVQQFQVVLDSDMMGNVFNTRASEAGDFLTWTLLSYLLGYGLLPALLISRLQPVSKRRLSLLGHWLLWLLLGAGGIYAGSSGWLWIDQHAKQLGARLLPWSYLINSARYQVKLNQQNQSQILLPDLTVQSDSDALVVLVIGEAARAANFSLYGYPRETNPELRKHGAIALEGATSCTTYTTGSLKCILGHGEGELFGGPYEPLPSYLQRHGVEVLWRSNNWGEPPLKVAQYQQADELKAACTGAACDTDALLLSGLPERISAAQSGKMLVVLHQQGSHGPRYYQRYPKDFARFSPVCRSVELSRCEPQSLVNAYDNSLLYTDYLLGQLIEQLKAFSQRPVLLMYLSDHGESLGEYGLYLHGTPYSLAPEFQKHIPFVLWMNQRFMDTQQLDITALRQRSSHNQHQVFHSLLSAFGMRSEIYNPSLDLFSKAR